MALFTPLFVNYCRTIAKKVDIGGDGCLILEFYVLLNHSSNNTVFCLHFFRVSKNSVSGGVPVSDCSAQVEEPPRGLAWGTPPPRAPPGTTGPPPAGRHRRCTTARPRPHTSGHRSPPAAPRLCTLPRQHQRPPETQHMVRLLPLVKSNNNLSKYFMFSTKESEIFHQCYKKLLRRGRNVIKV